MNQTARLRIRVPGRTFVVPGAAIVGALVLVASGCGGDSSGGAETTNGGTAARGVPSNATGTDTRRATSRIDVAEVSRKGIGVGLHPTAEPIEIERLDANDAVLEVCPAGGVAGESTPVARSSWGRWWEVCRILGVEILQLAPTDGRSHVGFRVRPARGSALSPISIRVTWMCADSYRVIDTVGQAVDDDTASQCTDHG